MVARISSWISLALIAFSLFIPWVMVGRGDDALTGGPLGGDVSEPKLLVMVALPLLAGIIAASARRGPGRVRGIVVTVLAVLGLAFLGLAVGDRSLYLGYWLALVGSAVALLAGIAAIVRPARPAVGELSTATA